MRVHLLRTLNQIHVWCLFVHMHAMITAMITLESALLWLTAFGQTCCAIGPVYQLLLPAGASCTCASLVTYFHCCALLLAVADVCSSLQCQHGGTCIIRGNQASCRCPAGFAGSSCESDCWSFGMIVEPTSQQTCVQCPSGYIFDRSTYKCGKCLITAVRVCMRTLPAFKRGVISVLIVRTLALAFLQYPCTGFFTV